MRVTKENVGKVIKLCWLPTYRPMTSESASGLLNALLDDIEELNEKTLPAIEELTGVSFKFPRVFIGVQDFHDDSDEIPDYYGAMRIYSETTNDGKDSQFLDPLSPELDLDGIDENLCSLVSYFDSWLEKLQEDEKKDKDKES